MRLLILISALLAPFANAPLPAQSRPTQPDFRLGTDQGKVLLDQPGDGNLWAVARTYKLRAGPDGVDYVPFFGSKAPRNHPLGLRLGSVRRGQSSWSLAESPTLQVDEAGFRLQHGAIEEVWSLSPEGAEQTFRVSVAPGEGDLVVRLSVATDMLAERAIDGLCFRAAGLGHVTYGDLTVHDAAGRTWAAPAVLEDGGIVLRVADEFLRQAAFPLVLDPLVSTFAIDNTVRDTDQPDVAYDATTDRWLVVCTLVQSTVDGDILARRFDGAGTLLDEVIVDATFNGSLRASVADNDAANQFLVVWEDTAFLLQNNSIEGRTRAAGSTSQSAKFRIQDSTFSLYPRFPAVSGASDPSAQGNTYLVTYAARASSVSATSIDCRLVRTDTTVLPDVTVSTTGFFSSMPKLRTGSNPWCLAYESGASVRAATVSRSGSVVQNEILVMQSAQQPEIDGFGDTWMVVAVSSTGQSILGARMHLTPTGLAPAWSANLTGIEPGTINSVDYELPAVSFDGTRFVYFYTQTPQVSGGNGDLYFATGYGDTGPVMLEGHVALATTGDLDLLVRAASRGPTGRAGRHFVCWERRESSTQASDVNGGLVDGIQPGPTSSFVSTGCGLAFEPLLTLSDLPLLGTSITITATPIAPSLQLFLIGLKRATPLTLCAGHCGLGVDPILTTSGGASWSLTIPADPGLMGATFAAENVLFTPLTGCSSTLIGIPFVTSDTLVFTVR